MKFASYRLFLLKCLLFDSELITFLVLCLYRFSIFCEVCQNLEIHGNQPIVESVNQTMSLCIRATCWNTLCYLYIIKIALPKHTLQTKEMHISGFFKIVFLQNSTQVLTANKDWSFFWSFAGNIHPIAYFSGINTSVNKKQISCPVIITANLHF